MKTGKRIKYLNVHTVKKKKRIPKKYILSSVAVLVCILGMSSCTVVADMATAMYWNLDDPIPVDPNEMLDTLYVIQYSAGGKTGQKAIHNSADLDMLLYSLLSESRKVPCSLVRNSHEGAQGSLYAAKEESVVRFTSGDTGKVKEWVKRMLLKGYRVEIVYDKKERVFNCIARLSSGELKRTSGEPQRVYNKK